MIYLSKSALKYAVSKCREDSNCKIVIVQNGYEDNLYISNTLGEYLSEIQDYAVSKEACGFQVWFNNGSVIRILPTREDSHGVRCHLVIADKRISSEILSRVFSPMEILERIRTDRISANENL